jgi:hypothetical protein
VEFIAEIAAGDEEDDLDNATWRAVEERLFGCVAE